MSPHGRHVRLEVALRAYKRNENPLGGLVDVEDRVSVPAPLLVAALAIVYSAGRASGTSEVHIHCLQRSRVNMHVCAAAAMRFLGLAGPRAGRAEELDGLELLDADVGAEKGALLVHLA